MRNILLILLLFSLPGCQPGKESPAFSAVLQKVQCMIEQDSFPDKYVILYELVSNDIGSVYKVTPSGFPLVEWSLERPEDVIRCKDKYICLINPAASVDISKKRLVEMTNYPNDTCTPTRDKLWYMGVSKNGKKQTLISTHRLYHNFYFYAFPQLWEYAFKDYDANRLPRYLLEMYSFIVDSCEASPEELGNHIQYIQGEIYYTSPSDNCFAETKNDEYRSFFAVLNGKDTLQLNIRDTIGQHLLFKSVDNAAFFQSLPKNDTWYKLYDLLRDSTFYFQNQKGSFIRYSIPFNPACWRFSVNGMCGQGCYDLYKRGVKVSLKDLDSYDKWNVD